MPVELVLMQVLAVLFAQMLSCEEGTLKYCTIASKSSLLHIKTCMYPRHESGYDRATDFEV